MRRRKMLTGVLTVALLVGCISPLGVTGTEMPEDVWAEQLVIPDETESLTEGEEVLTAEEDLKSTEADANELQDDTKEQVTGEEYTKSAEADANGFVIENGVLTGYTGEGGDVTIPDGVTSIGASAFLECGSSITNIIIPNSVTSIERNAFGGCISLTSITIPGSVTSIGRQAFGYCSSLTSITVLEENKNYTSEDGILYDKDKHILIYCPPQKRDVVIPESVTSIETYAFYGCNKLSKVITIPEYVTSIGEYAFLSCNSLPGIIVPESVTSIEYPLCDRDTYIICKKDSYAETYAKQRNYKYIEYTEENIETELNDFVIEDGALTDYLGSERNVVIPNEVTAISSYAFENCSNIISVTIPESVTDISITAFNGCNDLIEINVDSDNPQYSSEGGVLYNKEKSKCLLCPKGMVGEVVISDNVVSIESWAFEYCDKLTNVVIPEKVTEIGTSAFSYSGLTTVVLPKQLETIESQLFDGCSKLTHITIPESVTNIRNFAFSDCTSLTSITIPQGVESIGYSTFEGCNKLADITLPELETIQTHLFKGCSSLNSITIPSSVKTIEDGAFAYCSSLENIIIEGSTDESGAEYNAFQFTDGMLYDNTGKTLLCCVGSKSDTANVLPGVTAVSEEAFSGCSKLKSITIPSSVTEMNESWGLHFFNSSFQGCNELEEITVGESNTKYQSINGMLYSKDGTELLSCPPGKCGTVNIPSNVTDIGRCAFQDCSSLTEIVMSDSVRRINCNAFSGCSRLTDITLSDNITTIETEAFSGCSSLKELTIPDKVTRIYGYAFKDCTDLMRIKLSKSLTSIGELAFSGCSSLTEITIPENITTIAYGVFSGCKKLETIILPDNMGSIGESVFANCSGLKAITIPDNVGKIGESAFANCSGLETITIPGNVVCIQYNTFKQCVNLEKVIIPDSVIDIDARAFRECDNLTIYCEKGSYAETYAKARHIPYKYIGEKDAQTITATDNITKTYGDSAFSIGATTDGDGVLSYTSDNEAVAKVDSAGTITLTGAGTAHIIVTASETDTYNAAEKVVIITVEKKSQTITASDITKTYGDSVFSIGAATDGDGTLTYVSDDTSVATVDANGIVTLVNIGTAHITIRASETANYKAAEKMVTIAVNPAETASEIPSETPSEDPENPSKNPEENEQTITAKNITKTYGDKPFSLGVKTNGGGKLTYKISNTKIATIDKKGKVTIKSCGQTRIKITAAANGNYQKATKTITLTVKPKKTTVTSVKSTKSKALTVKWKQDKKAKGYIIEYSTDKKFKKNVKTVTISKNSTVSKTFTKLKGGKKYYVRVCAYTTADGKKIKGSYSKVMSIKVKK